MNESNQISRNRRIRSFVRREGRMTTGQKKAIVTLWSVYGLNPDEPLADIHMPFGRQAPVVLEIGFGMGDSLAQQAANQPQQDFIGIEVHRPGVGHLLSLIDSQSLTNIRLYCADAVEVLNHCIPNASLSGVQVFFPDPWPKKRHHKRRLIQKSFIQLVASKLTAQGTIHLATDWENYAEHMLQVMNSCEELTNTSNNGQFVNRPASRPLTKFESRGQRLGHDVWDLLWRKKT